MPIVLSPLSVTVLELVMALRRFATSSVPAGTFEPVPGTPPDQLTASDQLPPELLVHVPAMGCAKTTGAAARADAATVSGTVRPRRAAHRRLSSFDDFCGTI